MASTSRWASTIPSWSLQAEGILTFNQARPLTCSSEREIWNEPPWTLLGHQRHRCGHCRKDCLQRVRWVWLGLFAGSSSVSPTPPGLCLFPRAAITKYPRLSGLYNKHSQLWWLEGGGSRCWQIQRQARACFLVIGCYLLTESLYSESRKGAL